MPITRDNILLAVVIILALWAVVSTVLGVSAIVREALAGELRAGTVVRGVSAVLGLVLVLWGLTVAIGL